MVKIKWDELIDKDTIINFNGIEYILFRSEGKQKAEQPNHLTIVLDLVRKVQKYEDRY